MRKSAIVLMSFIVLTISCERDTVNTKVSTSNDLSELQLLADNLGISEKYNLPAIVHNPDNKFEVVGILHNYGCDFLSEKMENSSMKSFDFESFPFIKYGHELAQKLNIEIPDGVLEAFPYYKLNSKGGFIDDGNLKSLVDNGLMDKNLENHYIKLRDIVLKCPSLEEAQKSVVLLENEFMSDASLTKSEKENILSACALFRYSSAYWASKGIDTPAKGWLENLFIGMFDVVGFCFGTALGGNPAAGVIIGAQASFGCWVGITAEE